MAAPRYVLPWRPRKRSTYEQPPDDPAAFFERPPLRRRTTLLSFIGTSADEDPFPGRYYDEPQRISAGHDATIHEIDLLAEADWSKIPKPLDSRSTTGLETPSRTSSVNSEDDLSVTLSGLVLGSPTSIYDHCGIGGKSWCGLNPNIHSLPSNSGSLPHKYATTGPSTGNGGRPDRRSSNRSTTNRALTSTNNTFSGDRIQSGRVTKPAGSIPVEAKDKQPVRTPQLPLGCPMVKGNHERYMSVIGPCTDLKGITPAPKALNEHLKKQHSRKWRCMTCYRWHKNEEDLLKHQVPKRGFQRCHECCKHIKDTEFSKHRKESEEVLSCRPDLTTKPQLFSAEQEEAFRKNRNQSGKWGNLEKKYRQIYASLWPEHDDVDTIWPFYDFTSFTHKLPMIMTRDERLKYAGGIRRVPTPETEEQGLEVSPLSTEMELSPLIPFMSQGSTQAWPPSPSFQMPHPSGPVASSSQRRVSTAVVATPLTAPVPRTTFEGMPAPPVAPDMFRHPSNSTMNSTLPGLTQGSQSQPTIYPSLPPTPLANASIPPSYPQFFNNTIAAPTFGDATIDPSYLTQFPNAMNYEDSQQPFMWSSGPFQNSIAEQSLQQVGYTPTVIEYLESQKHVAANSSTNFATNVSTNVDQQGQGDNGNAAFHQQWSQAS